MSIIKKSSLVSILALMFLFASCDQGAITSSNEKNDQVEPEVALINLGNSFNEIEPMFQNLTETVRLNRGENSKQIRKSLSNNQIGDVNKMLNHLSNPALTFFNSLGFTDNDYKEAFGSADKSEIGKKAAGYALLILKLRACAEKNPAPLNKSLNYGTMSGAEEDTPKVVTCALEATGLAAGATIIGGLAYGTLGKNGKKAVLKAVAKIGGRTLSGIGLALVAAEFTWCMAR